MSMNNAALELALRQAMGRLTNALVNRDAPNSLKLEGFTLAEITASILAGTAANATLFDGKTYGEVLLAVTGGSEDTLQSLSDDLAAFIARTDNPHNVTKAQVGLGDVVNYGVATQADADAKAADKYATTAIVDYMVSAAVNALVGAAPATLDTINELAAALNNDPDIINNLMSEIGTKETPAGAQAKADAAQAAAIAASETYADQAEADALAAAQAYTDTAIAGVSGSLDRADQAEAEAGTDAVKLMTPLTTSQAIAAIGGSLFLGANAQAADSALLEGQTLAQVLAAAQAGVDLSGYVQKTDNLGQYNVTVDATSVTLTAFLETLATETDLGTLQSAFNAFVAAKASTAEVIAGTDDSKYTTALAVKGAIQDAIDSLVGAAPAALDTINELATALNNDPDVINNLTSLIGTKLTQAEVQAEIAGVTDGLDTRLTAVETAIGGGSNFMQTGVTDLGTNPLALDSDGENPALSLKARVESLIAVDTATDARITTEVAGLNTSIGNLQSTLEAADQAIADDVAALTTTVTDNNTAATGRLDAIEAALPSKLEAGDNIDTNLVTVDSTPTALATVVANLQAAIAAAESGASTDLAALQDSFNAFVAAKASTAEIIAGTDDAKYTTSLGVKGAIDAAISELVGTAPEALDTINELAAALNNDPDVINNLMTQIGSKLDATATAVDSDKLGGVAAADYALKSYVDTAQEDTLEALTEGFIAQALNISSFNSDTITITESGGFYGAHSAAAVTAGTGSVYTVESFKWDGSTAVLTLAGDTTTSGIDAVMLGNVVLNELVSETVNGGSTVYTFTMDKTFPTSGTAVLKF
jgi:hypothetical protein